MLSYVVQATQPCLSHTDPNMHAAHEVAANPIAQLSFNVLVMHLPDTYALFGSVAPYG